MEFKKIVVAGGGVLGSQIAFQSAYQGFDVTIWLRSEGSIARCKPKIDGLLATYQGILENMRTDESIRCPGISRAQHLTDAQIDELKDRALKAHGSIKLIASYEEAFSDADLVIEAVAEDPKQKEAFYGELAKHLPAKTVLVTNSSTLLPSKLAPFTDRPEKYLALHFANEIWIHNTAEVMGHPGTDPAVYQKVVEFAKAIGMVPLQLHKEQPGYLLNSLLVPFLQAAQGLYAEGIADPQDIDLTWKIGTGAPLGPFQILDVVGLTTAYNICLMNPQAQDPTSTAGKIVAMLKKMIDEGRTGKAAGEGFYSYDDEKSDESVA